LHLQLALATCTSNLHLELALPTCTCNLHFQLALPTCTITFHAKTQDDGHNVSDEASCSRDA
jgi:hypothetical protein